MTKLLIEDANETEVMSTLITSNLMDYDFELYPEGRNVVVEFYSSLDEEVYFVETLEDLGYYVRYYNRAKS